MYKLQAFLTALVAVYCLFGLTSGETETAPLPDNAISAVPNDTAKPPETCKDGEEDAYHVDPSDCSKFYYCKDKRRFDFVCNPKNLHFNPSTVQCDYPENVDCGK